MKINESYSRTRLGDLNSKIELERSEANRSGATPGSHKRADHVDLSPIGRQVQQLLETAKTLPDVRSEKVDGLRRLYLSGHYNVDAEKLAGKIVQQGDEIDLIL